MSWPAWLFRIVPYLGRRRAGEDLEQEMRLHVELERDRLVDVGVAPDAAARVARRRLGNPALIREDTRAVWGWRWLDGLVWDLRHVARGLRRSPGFTAVVVAVLGLGIGGVGSGLLPRPQVCCWRRCRSAIRGSSSPSRSTSARWRIGSRRSPPISGRSRRGPRAATSAPASRPPGPSGRL